MRERLSRELQRQAGLADASRADQREQSRGRKLGAKVFEFFLPVDKTRQLERKIVRKLFERSQWRKDIAQVGCTQLVDALHVLQVLKSMLPEVGELQLVGQLSQAEIRGRAREE